MEQLTQTLISSAIVILGTLVTFITTNLTKKSVKSNNNDLAKKLDEIDNKLIEITKNNLKIEKKLINFELKTEKRIMNLENKVNILQIQQQVSKKETKENEI